MNPSKGHSDLYWTRRLKALVIDGLVVVVLLLAWQVVSNFDIALDLLKITFVRWDTSSEQLEYEHQESSGVFDIVVRYTRGKESPAKLLVLLGTAAKEISLSTVEIGEFKETILRSLPISTGSILRFTLVGDGVQGKGLEIFPVGKNVLKPKGVERLDEWNLFRAFLGGSGTSLTDLLISIVLILVLYQLSCFIRMDATLGMKIQKQKLVGRTQSKGLLAFCRAAGSVLSLLSLGLGSIQAYFSTYRQSWSDLLSGTYVVGEDEQVLLERRPENYDVFSDKKRIMGYFKCVPSEMIFLALVIDAAFVVFLWFAGYWIATTLLESDDRGKVVRLEAEEFELANVAVVGRQGASGGKVVQQAKVSEGVLGRTFRARAGSYAVILGYFSDDGSGRCELQIGEERMSYSLDQAQGQGARALLLRGLALKGGELVRLRLITPTAGRSGIDYVEFWPVESSPFGGGGSEGADAGELDPFGATVWKSAWFIPALGGCFVSYLVLFIIGAGRTLGAQIMGIKLVLESGRSTSWRNRLRALVILSSNFLQMIFGKTGQQSHRLRWWFIG
jgi:uncharacterized RDD family membrane protein YckC